MRLVSGVAYKRQFTLSHRLLSLINYLTKGRQRRETSKIELQQSAFRTSAMFLTSSLSD